MLILSNHKMSSESYRVDFWILHDMLRRVVKQNEMKGRRPLIKNRKYFLDPPQEGEDFKELFMKAASAGVGRPVDESGFPKGPWTPNLLAQAISEINENTLGIELRTVQLWFQENQRGVNPHNIRWLARVFGCDDPTSTVEWQAAISTAQSRLVAKRRQQVRKEAGACSEPRDALQTAAGDDAKWHEAQIGLARMSEAALSGSPLNLPSAIFAGATALGLLAYILGVHNVHIELKGGAFKQVGFMWAPNWTLLFMVFMPSFFMILAELVVFWKDERQSIFVSQEGIDDSHGAWLREVETSSYTFWAVFLICTLFAGLLQWFATRMLPLLNGQGSFAPDWGLYAIDHPEAISVPESITFTGLAYLYMSLCFYLFMAGLILLYTVAHDFRKILATQNNGQDGDRPLVVDEVAFRLMVGIFRCTVLGVLIAICMKLQSVYLSSDGANIVEWLVDDITSVFGDIRVIHTIKAYKHLNHFSSLILVMSTVFVFLYGASKLSFAGRHHAPVQMMITTIVLLVVSYMLIGAFGGFSILLGIGVILALFGLVIPDFGTQ